MMDVAIFTAVAVAIAAQVYISPIQNVSTVKVLLVYFASALSLFVYLVSSSPGTSYFSVIVRYVALNATFLITAVSLTVLRRIYFSPLSKFPGLKFAAATNLWKAKEYSQGHHARTILALHRKYNSDIVRTGPYEVSIKNVDAVERIYKGRYPRGAFYEAGAMYGDANLNSQGDYNIHGPWRRIWEKAFVSSEFKDYNPRVEYHAAKLAKAIRKTDGEEVDGSTIMDNYVFDIMADLSFAHDAGMQDGTGDNSYMDFIHKYVAIFSVVATLRNLAQLIVYLPETADVRAFRQRGEALLATRQKLGSSRKDIFRHLLAEDSESPCKFTQGELNSNANVLIAAGSDTTSSTLTQTLRMLAKERRILKKLQKEVDLLPELNVETTRKCTYLAAVVNEALRLCNPLPSGAYAATPPAGVTVAGTFIPGNTQVIVSHLGLMTDERYFLKGEEFIPERWTGEWDEGILERKAFVPFGYGLHSCVGKQLALNEMKLGIASVVRYFDVVLGESYSEDVWQDEWKDYAVLQVGALPVKFLERA